MLEWIKHSGAAVSVTINPLHWSWVPWAGPEYQDVWSGPNNRTYYAKWLMLTIRVWIDDGSW
jgi:hypothetical protein